MHPRRDDRPDGRGGRVLPRVARDPRGRAAVVPPVGFCRGGPRANQGWAVAPRPRTPRAGVVRMTPPGRSSVEPVVPAAPAVPGASGAGGPAAAPFDVERVRL